MLIYQFLLAVGLPVAAAASLPLSYRLSKPFWLIWALGFGLALVSSIQVLLTFGALSVMFGTSGGNSGFAPGFGILNRLFGMPWMLITLSPFLLAWLLHANRTRWAGIVKPLALESLAIIAILSLIPFGAGAKVWSDISGATQQRDFAQQQWIAERKQKMARQALRLSVD